MQVGISYNDNQTILRLSRQKTFAIFFLSVASLKKSDYVGLGMVQEGAKCGRNKVKATLKNVIENLLGFPVV